MEIQDGVIFVFGSVDYLVDIAVYSYGDDGRKTQCLYGGYYSLAVKLVFVNVLRSGRGRKEEPQLYHLRYWIPMNISIQN